jgi:phosphoribosylaminoimidazole-succinocarboxamide synthase
MKRRRVIYEGKAKILYEGTEPGTVIQYFKDDATAGNGAKKDTIEGKGVLNNRISEYLMTQLQGIGVPTHFVRRLNMREQLIKEVEIIPLEVVVRNVAAGSMSKRLGIEEGTALPRSIIEYYYKNDGLQDPWVSEEHITAFGWASPQDLDDIVNLTIRVNDFLSGLLGAGIKLVDFKLNSAGCGKRLYAHRAGGRDQPGQLPLVGRDHQRKLDKDRFRRDMGGVVEAYSEVAKRLGIMPESVQGENKGPVLVQ